MAMDDFLADMSLIKLEEEIWRAEEALRMDMLKFGESEGNIQEKSGSETEHREATEHMVFFSSILNI